MGKNKVYYISFPVSLLSGFQESLKDSIYLALSYGVCRFAERFDKGKDLITRQVYYDYYNGEIPCYLHSLIDDLTVQGVLIYDEDYRGFGSSGNGFDPVDVIELQEAIYSDSIAIKHAEEHYYNHCVKRACELTKIEVDIESAIKQYLEYGKNDSSPTTSINASVLIGYYHNDKSEKEVMQLLCCLGLKSIVGTKSYCKTNKELTLARMYGYASQKALRASPVVNTELYKKYHNRYHWDQLIESMQKNWGFVYYSNYMRGFYVGSKSKISLKDLMIKAESKKAKQKKEKEDRKRLQIEVLKELGLN